MADGEKLTLRDIIEYVEAGWDATELSCFRAGVDGEFVGLVATSALIDAWIMGNVIPPQHYDDKTPRWRLMFVLEMMRRGIEASEARFDANLPAELDAFLEETLRDEEPDDAADGQ